MENIDSNLQAANMGIKNIVKLTIYLVGQIEASERRTIFEDYFKGFKPCMTLIFVAALAAPTILVEIDVMASCES